MPSNKVYINAETPLKFADSAQSPSKNLTLANLTNGAGRVSAQHDLGDSARSEWYEWRATFQFATTPVVGETVDIYLSTSDGIDEDGQEGILDAVLVSTNSLKNMYYIGSVVVTSTDASHDMTAAGVCRIVAQYFSIVVHNNTADSLKNDTSVNTIMITPIPQEVQ